MRAVSSAFFAAVLVAALLPAGCAPKEGEIKDPKLLDKKVAGKKADKDKIPWTPPLSKIQGLNRMRLQAQNAQWDNLDKLSAICVTYDDKDLLAFGHWYRALVSGYRNLPDQAMAHIQLAKQYGFKNADLMVSADVLGPVQDKEEFQAIVKDLSEKLENEMRGKFQKFTDAAFGPQAAKAEPWRPDLKTADGQPFFEPGKPSVAVLSRIHHDGLPKALAALKEAQTKVAVPVPVGVIFYQLDSDDEARKAQTKKYAEALGLKLPWAIVGQKDYAALTSGLASRDRAVKVALGLVPAEEAAPKAEAPKAEAKKATKKSGGGEEADAGGPEFSPLSYFNAFPVIVFFDGAGAPVHALEGVPLDWQAAVALEKFQAAVKPAGAPEVPATAGAPVTPEAPEAPKSPETPTEPEAAPEPKAEPAEKQ